jgi:hypothetical protein
MRIVSLLALALSGLLVAGELSTADAADKKAAENPKAPADGQHQGGARGAALSSADWDCWSALDL